jgi:hypothetical protein
MANNEFLGSALYAQWIGYDSTGTVSTGTVTLATDFRNFNYRPSIDIIDATAGADTSRRRITYLKDGQVTCTQVLQSDIGTATMALLTEGQAGTLTWAEAGTAAGKPKHVIPALCMGSSITTPYNDVVTIETTWQQNGARTDTVY